MVSKRPVSEDSLSGPFSDEDLLPITKKLKNTHLSGADGSQYASNLEPVNQNPALTSSIQAPSSPAPSRTSIINSAKTSANFVCAGQGPSEPSGRGEEDTPMDTLEYQPELDQSQNPFYYQPNRLLFEAHLERERQLKP
ncbi:hypothetical protein BV898_12439 [Hypsibius exemplaris]|uniref:Uncharacterized protein n=1 Tax=Hypsibius exemplaris TaxID=2072580 RepID=A0A1W0WDR0_HYPEX|nr:hypothetical protein BV898_12439 [Hypsibius exemplaris]